jgi:lipopolysaccharide transport system permease protein
MTTFLAFFFYFKFFTAAGLKIEPTILIWFLPVLVLQTALLSLGMGLWLSALTAKYRDLSLLMTFIIQLWMYATPIIYPASIIPEYWKILFFLNPMAQIVESFKLAFFGVGSVDLFSTLCSVFLTAGIVISGLMIFAKVERNFMDTV